MLAATDAHSGIQVYNTQTGDVTINKWVFHNARINSLNWSPDGKYACSGANDSNIEIWCVEKPMKHISIKNAHLESVNGVVWIGNDKVVSGGQDAILKVYEVKHYQ